MKIQYMSDLHIEHFRNLDDFESRYKSKFGTEIFSSSSLNNQVLVLAGDIGNPMKDSYRDFLKKCSEKYQVVIVVAGNHECYNNEYWTVMKKMESVSEEFENVHFLEQKSVEVEIDGVKVVFVGCLLWSHVPLEARWVVQNSMNDYEMISIMENEQKRNLVVNDTANIYEQSAKWLTEELEKHQGKNVVIVTHHAPLLRGVSSPTYEQDDLDEDTKLCNHAFSSDLSRLCKDPVKFWIFGHTHYSSNQTFNGIPVSSNQLGYISAAFEGTDPDNIYKEDTFFEL